MQFYNILESMLLLDRYASEHTEVYIQDHTLIVNRLRAINPKDELELIRSGWQQVYPNSNVWCLMI
jgi:hypothetical protein